MKSVFTPLAVAAAAAFIALSAPAQAQVSQAQVDAQVQEALVKALAGLDLKAVIQRAAEQAARDGQTPAPRAAARARSDCAFEEAIDEAPRNRRSRERVAEAEVPLDPETAAALKGMQQSMQQTALKTFLPMMQSMMTDTFPALMKEMQQEFKTMKR